MIEALMMKGPLFWLGLVAIAVVVTFVALYATRPIEKVKVVVDADTTSLAEGTGHGTGTAGGGDYGAFTHQFGPPDSDDSTQYDKPRPPLVTRWIEYEPEHVRIVFVPIAKVGEPPPYVGWKVFAFIDTKAERTLTRDEAERRLQGRIKTGR